MRREQTQDEGDDDELMVNDDDCGIGEEWRTRMRSEGVFAATRYEITRSRDLPSAATSSTNSVRMFVCAAAASPRRRRLAGAAGSQTQGWGAASAL
jgi:hypothetical protein